MSADEDLVYFLHDPETDLVKIGHSIDVTKRKKQLERQIGRPLRLLAVSIGGERREKEIHTDLAESREHGEWFRQSEFMGMHIDMFKAELQLMRERRARPVVVASWSPDALAYWGEWAYLLEADRQPCERAS